MSDLAGQNALRQGMQRYRERLREALPVNVVTALKAIRERVVLRNEFELDRRRYGRYSLCGEISCGLQDAANLEAQLTKDYHRIEKGLALSAPKRPFGAAVAARLDSNISSGEATGAQKGVIEYAKSARRALVQWNDSGIITDEIAPVAETKPGGLMNPDEFFGSRHSVRNFSNRSVDDNILRHAVSLAVNSPSVCNRQAWAIRFFSGSDVPRILAYQNGNKGFTHSVPVVGLITVDCRMFAAAGERNQPWIEGGIFAMSFVWALHALGVDTCMLNMSVRNRVVADLRSTFHIQDHELVIMMVAVGYAEPGHRVARSPRRGVDEVVIPGTSTSIRNSDAPGGAAF